MFTVDLETEAIEHGSNTMPRPVGIAIRPPHGGSYYMAFGHPEGNNCSFQEAREELLAIWDQPFVGHNIFAFDLPVLYDHFDMPHRPWQLTHDTLFSSYLHDPNAGQLSLKWLAEHWLGIPPDDQAALNQWIIANVPECRTKKQCGAFISRAPGDLVGRYAIADVEMTWALHQRIMPIIETMQEAYDRERELAPILASIQRRGIRVNTARLKQDYARSMEQLIQLDAEVRGELNAPHLNPGSSAELGAALQGAGCTGFLTTPTGRVSTNKQSLQGALQGRPALGKKLHSRATLATLTGTFMEPWLQMAERNWGTINGSYNQVRNPEGYGTRTGRLSSSNPNLQNVPGDQGEEFPHMRSYCLPDPGHVWISVDFKSQEPRLTAHYENDVLMHAFQDDPDLDPYEFVKELCGGQVTRKQAKVILLGLIYSMGAAALSVKLDCETDVATHLRNTIKVRLGGVVALDNNCKQRFNMGLPIRTLGGRLVNCEPPSNGRVWAYKALNLLIQGSAADQTKQAIIYANAHLPTGCRILGTVHDEINISSPPEHVDLVTEVMLAAANNLPCDVPMRITVGVGENWARAAK